MVIIRTLAVNVLKLVAKKEKNMGPKTATNAVTV
jgi:hypothetical protein